MRKISITFLIILLCASWFTTFPCEAATVWSDDFDDGDYEGWTVTIGSFSAEENTLEAGTGDLNFVYHPSSVATGTWSFDISSETFALVYFMCSDGAIDQVNPISIDRIAHPDPACFLTINWVTDSVGLYRSIRDGDRSDDVRLAAYDSKTGFSGWQHIDVTRNSDGRICVYHEGDLIIDTVDRSITSITTSQFFAFWSSEEAAIDNIVVSNTVDILPPPPTPFYLQTWFLAAVGAVVFVAAFVIIAVMMRRK